MWNIGGIFGMLSMLGILCVGSVGYLTDIGNLNILTSLHLGSVWNRRGDVDYMGYVEYFDFCLCGI